MGRKVGAGVNPNDNYVTEPTATRTNYQLEPGVVFLRPDTDTAFDALTYPGMIDALNANNANTRRQDRLFEQQYYAWDPFCDLDKFSNYSQYYWLANGPDPVDVSSTTIPLTDDFTVTRNVLDYEFSGIAGTNPVITLARGGSYNFAVNQAGHKFWIQTAPGVNGTVPGSPNISSRNVLGVINNGDDNGTVQFNVPRKDAQNFYFGLTQLDTPVDLVTETLLFNQVNNVYVSDFLARFPQGIDGITELNGLNLVFANRVGDADGGGWRYDTQYDPLVRTTPDRIGFYISYDIIPRTTPDRFSTTVSYDLVTRTVPDNIGTVVSYDLVTRTVANRITDFVSFDSVPYDPQTRVTPQYVSASYGFDVTGVGFDSASQPFADLVNVIVSGSPDPQDGDVGTYDVKFLETTGPVDPLDGTPGTFDYDPLDSSEEHGFDQPTIDVDLAGVEVTYDDFPFDDGEFQGLTLQPGQFDPLDGTPGTFDYDPVDSSEEHGFDQPEIMVITGGPADPGDGLPGTFDAAPYEQPQVLVVSGPADPLDGQNGSYDSIPFDEDIDINSRATRYSVWQIQYLYDGDNQPFMRLANITEIPQQNRFRVRYGAEFSNTEWWKDAAGFIVRVPPLSAVLDELWYQDSTNPDIFGQIKLVDIANPLPINIDDIIGAKNYTSPNGVKFTNGLQIQFRGPTVPAQYQNQKFYVEGVGTGPGINQRVGFVDGEAYFGPYHIYQGVKLTGRLHDDETFQQIIYDTAIESKINAGRAFTPERDVDRVRFGLDTNAVDGVLKDNGILLIPVSEMATPEPYNPDVLEPFDGNAVLLGNFNVSTSQDPLYLAGIRNVTWAPLYQYNEELQQYVVISQGNEVFTPDQWVGDRWGGGVGFDNGGFDNTLNSPVTPDYITINRASADRNSWSRNNRWFHKDVIEYTAQLNNNYPVYDNNLRAKRPIVEFRPNLRLFNCGAQAKPAVNVIDFNTTDAISVVNGSIGYGVDGYEFRNGSLVIFAADTDITVRNRIFRVEFFDPDDSGQLLIRLAPLPNNEALINQTVTCLNGATQQGKVFWFDGSTWVEGQQKTGVNQAPLFDVYDANGVSFGNQQMYPSTTFRGSQLFGYARGESAVIDPVLGFPFKYRNIDNIGDIVFENYLYTENFVYVRDRVSYQVDVGDGFVRQYLDRVSFFDQIGWQPAAARSRQRQVFRFVYNNEPLLLDVPIDTATVFAPVQMFVNGIFVDPNNYTVTTTALNSTITMLTPPPVGTTIEVQIFGPEPSDFAFYQIPVNLENNALNDDPVDFTLGGIRNHYGTIGQNLRNIVGPVNGANNTRDLGNIVPWGSSIIQNSAPLVLPSVFWRREQFAFFQSLEFSSREYTKYKALLLDLAGKGDFINNTPTQILDLVVEDISLGKTEQFPFYWSDMLPSGDTFTSLDYTFTPISTNTFDTSRVYDFNSSNYQSLMVYLNGEILTRDYDYTVPDDRAVVIVNRQLQNGDQIQIREYSTTYGSYVPNTPTKMGMYPSYRPMMYLDESYIVPQMVIRGHDGSVTFAFGDFRDQVLLEFETRIFNNIKVNTPVPLLAQDVIPGQFRDTGWSLSEITSIMLPSFLSWVGLNSIDYTSQQYSSGNPFTYNYSQSQDKIDGRPLLGSWRAIYNYFYDTLTPNTTPWEMLGFTEEPDWWQERYGPAPYTSGNMVLWGDLQAGFIADPVDPRFDARFARPGLTSVIPAGSEGQLLDPLKCVVGNFDATSFERSWTFGDDGPVENAWRTSSVYPFAVMRLLALTRPAEFFGLFVDRDRYRFNDTIQQYLWNDRYRINPKDLAPLYGSGTSRASYINWIIDYNQIGGVNSQANLTRDLDNVDVRLCWRLAGYSGKNLLQLFTERSTPLGENRSLLLPDESYQILLYTNVPQNVIDYSSVMIMVSANGWQVVGYDLQRNFFEILQSNIAGPTTDIAANGSIERVATTYLDDVVQVPYGFEFTTRAAVCDFILSYGALLERRGFSFTRTENGYLVDWKQMAVEFLYWSNQGWGLGTAINLNPGGTELTISRPGQIAAPLFPTTAGNYVLNQNRGIVPAADLVVTRTGNTLRLQSLAANTINYVSFKFFSYEHMVILNNRSIFNDLIYSPSTGARQNRILVSGAVSAEWDGTVNAPGFVLNQDNVPQWRPNVKYTKGEIVLFKDEYWSASTIIQPSAEFDYSQWIKSDYAEIQTGLLPNAALASDELANSYDTYSANLETDVDLFSYGLIGFRPRRYMQLLDLSDVSQVNLYKQFLKDKGTSRATDVFNLANLGKEVARYDVYENWAMLRSVYGANANRSYFEVVLNEANLQSNPSIIQIVQSTVDPSEADQKIVLDDVWKSSYALTSPNILPATLNPTVPEQGLPTAGYVNLDDVNITIFDLDQPTDPTIIQQINVGTTVWVARVNTYEWNIYRAEKIPAVVTAISDNLDGASVVTFTSEHGLSVGDVLIIKYFSTDVDGYYRVLSVPSLTTVTIAYEFTGFQTTQEGTGLALTLQTARVREPSDISELPYASQLFPGVRAWVDTDSQGRWSVLEKTDAFNTGQTLTAEVPVLASRFGGAISQGLFNRTALIGAPQYNPENLATAPGAIYNFVSDEEELLVQRSATLLNATDVASYGFSIYVGDQTWSVAGAPASNDNVGYVTTTYVEPGTQDFTIRQLLLPPDQDFGAAEFGYAVTMSEDERWMFAGAPGKNKVYVYNQVPIQRQRVEYISDGVTNNYTYSNDIVVDYSQPEQIRIFIDDTLLDFQEGDYTVAGGTAYLTVVPERGAVISIQRNQTTQLDRRVIDDYTPQNLYAPRSPLPDSSIPPEGSEAKFIVTNQRGVYVLGKISGGINYRVDDLLLIPGSALETQDVPVPADLTPTVISNVADLITVDDTTGILPGMSVYGTGIVSGQYVTQVVNSTQFIISALPDATPSGVLTIGHDLLIKITGVDGDGNILSFTANTENATYPGGVTDGVVFPLNQYLYTAQNIYSFVVNVNNQLYRPYIDYEFNADSAYNFLELIFLTVPPAGATITVSSDSYYTYNQTLTVSGLEGDARFGHSIAVNRTGQLIAVGAPGTSNGAGSVYFFKRSVQNFQVQTQDQSTYTTVLSLDNPGAVGVAVNSTYLLPTTDNIGGQFVASGGSSAQIVTLLDTPVNVGDVVTVDTNQINLLAAATMSSPTAGSNFGWSIDQCVFGCSLLAGAPNDPTTIIGGGRVEFWQNIPRYYGAITTEVANPTLTVGDYIAINDYYIQSTGTTVESLAADIIAAKIPNVTAYTTPNIEYPGDNRTKIFPVGSIYSDATSYTPVVYIDDVLQTLGVDYTYDAVNEEIVFVVAPFVETTVTIVSGRLTISVKNSSAATNLDKLNVGPGTGTIFTDLGISILLRQQIIRSPVNEAFAAFGQAVKLSDDTFTLVVGAPNGSMVLDTNFDRGNTVFDSDGTTFSDTVAQSGVAYSYDALNPATPSPTNPPRFIFGQQFTDNNAESLDRFGAAVDLTTGVLLMGSPGADLDDSALADFGKVSQYRNLQDLPAWLPVRVQQPEVDVNLLNTIFMYDRISGQPRQYFDFMNPIQGRLLGVVKQNIDFIGAVDPAFYNTGPINNNGSRWGQQEVGKIWWNISNVRYIDPNQDDIVYASRRWGQLFPGSVVEIYQWVSSPVPPADYVGPGTVFSTESYVISAGINEQGFLDTQYFFWVTGIDTVNTAARKTLSTVTLSRYIENPRGSGISYIAPLSSSAVAIFNGLPYISAEDTVLHIEYDRQYNDQPVHVEYQLIPQDRAEGFLSDGLYKKFLDSMSGADTFGNAVPDPMLTPSEKYGVQFRPRQSLFANRFLALKNYIQTTNAILKQIPIVEQRRFSILNSFDPPPARRLGLWDLALPTFQELLYQDLRQVPLGYRYLVLSDETNNGLWDIYTVIQADNAIGKDLRLSLVQNYDTRKFWSYVDWYRPGYNPSSRIVTEVRNVAALVTLDVPVGSSVKVQYTNTPIQVFDGSEFIDVEQQFPVGGSVRVGVPGSDIWEIYQLEYVDDTKTVTEWQRVGRKDGTIEISDSVWNYSIGNFGYDREAFDAQYFDQAPLIETRKIIEAINQELFIDELLIERNRLLTLMFNFILSEQQAPNWLTKTSLINVNHIVRDLLPFQNYRRDNQDFILDYINEVKPYHVQIKEFSLKYNGQDTYLGSLADYDLPAYFDVSENQYVSPILDDNDPPIYSTTSSVPSTSPVWQTFPWNQWFNNYKLSIDSVAVISGGSGYTVRPAVTVLGTAVRPAQMTARINSAGQVVEIIVNDPGQGYSTAATIVISGGNGSGARAVAIMDNPLVRGLTTTIKYDRYQYRSDILTWQSGVLYPANSQVRYADRVWTNAAAVQGTEFDPDDWSLVNAGTLSGVDRTMGFYAPTATMPGLDLSQLISGVDYPGVQVAGLNFNYSSGYDAGSYVKRNFDVANSTDPLYVEGYRDETWSSQAPDKNPPTRVFTPAEWVADRWTGGAGFDTVPFDNYSISEEGLVTYDPSILDAVYEAPFDDPFLGTRPTDINVDGGAFIDTYSSHAPEELVPGSEFDTLDLRVYTSPGDDWQANGHGWPLSQFNVQWSASTPAVSFADRLTYPVAVIVYNLTTRTRLDLGTDYTVDWVNYRITPIDNVTNGQVLSVYVYALGGGHQIVTRSYLGSEMDYSTLSVIMEVPYDIVSEFAIFANGVPVTDYTFEPAPGAPGFTVITFTPNDSTIFGDDDRVTITAMGASNIEPNTTWSLPLTQYHVSDGSTFFTLDNSMMGTNPINLVVCKNGIRARPAQSARYYGDGTTTVYNLPVEEGYDQSIVADNDVSVYVNNRPLTLGVDFVVNPFDDSSIERTVTFTTAPADGSTIIIAVRTAAQYWVIGDTLVFQPAAGLQPTVGDVISVTSWNDTAYQDLLTQVFVGPRVTGQLNSEGFDTTLFDEGTINDDPGAYDFGEGNQIFSNRFNLGFEITNASRLTVTLDGNFLFPDRGFTTSGPFLTIQGPILNFAQVVTVTSATMRTVPAASRFRIFQDMRGLQRLYRITPETTTRLTQPLSSTSDVIHVEDARKLDIPDLQDGIFGLITINGERIAYRNIDRAANTVSGLRRGTAGTGAANHAAGSEVIDIGRGNLFPAFYQNRTLAYDAIGDGTTLTFEAEDINLNYLADSTDVLDQVVLVYIAGERVTSGYTITDTFPLTVQFDDPPPYGYQVSIRVYQGQVFYDDNNNVVSLQNLNTGAALFLGGSGEE